MTSPADAQDQVALTHLRRAEYEIRLSIDSLGPKRLGLKKDLVEPLLRIQWCISALAKEIPQ